MAKLTLSTGKELIVEESRDLVYDKKKEDKNTYLTKVYLTNSGKRQTKSMVLLSKAIISVE